MHEHALDWCPTLSIGTGKPGQEEEEIRLRTGNFLAWINQQNRINHQQLSNLRAKVDREKQQYFYDVARLAIESVINSAGTCNAVVSRSPSGSESPLLSRSISANDDEHPHLVIQKVMK